MINLNEFDKHYKKTIDNMRKCYVDYEVNKKPTCGVHVRDSEDIVFEGPGAFNFCPNCGEYLREDKD